jgi:hypothetical protein
VGTPAELQIALLADAEGPGMQLLDAGVEYAAPE